MANVNSTRMRVVLVDDMTAPLIRMQEALNGFNSVLKGVGTGGGQSLSSVNKKVNELNASVQVASKGFTKMGAVIGIVLTAYENFGRLSTMLGNSLGQVFDYAKELQTNTVGVSGILASMTQVNGKQLEWNQAMSISADIMKELKSQALQTAATSKDLMNTFRAILGPGLSKGMKISEILDFTKVGVNAVKSLGLNDVQLVQELRSILQGNIRDASSTLATALGITNQDIKNAKNQVGGVYQFLMDRMKGFRNATTETTKTMAGQFEILKEAVIVAGEEASKNILGTYSQFLERINSKILVKQGNIMGINPEIIKLAETLASAMDYIANKGINFVEFVYDKMELIAGYIGSFVLLPKALELSKPVVTFLADKVFEIKNSLSTIFNNMTGATSEALRRTTTINALANADAEALAQKTLNDLKAKYNRLLTDTGKISKAAAYNAESMLNTFKQLGLTEEEAYKRVNQYLTAVTDGNKQLKLSMEQSFAAAQKANTELTSMTSRLKNGFLSLCGVVNKLSGALSTVGFAMLTFADSEDKSTQKTAEWLIQADLMINAISLIISNLKVACTWFGNFSKARLIAMGMGKAGVGFAGAGFALGAGTLAVGAHSLFGENGVKDLTDAYRRAFWTKEDWDNYNIEQGLLRNKLSKDKQFFYDDNQNIRELIGNDDTIPKANNLTSLFGDKDDTKKKKGKTAQDVANDYQSFITSIRNTTSALNENQSAFDKTMEGAEKQLDTWQKKLDKMKQTGLLSQEDYDKAKTLMSNYFNDMIVKANEAQEKQNESLMKLHVEQAQLTMELGRGGQAEEYKLMNESLQVEKAYYEDKLNNKKLEIEERIRLEKEYASVVKQIRDNNMYDYKTAWRATLEELSQQQINYGDSIKSVFSTIESAGTNLLTSTENFGTKIKTFFSDVAASIMSEMAKIIMKGLITNAILSMIGMGYKGKSYSDLTKMPISNYGPQLPGKATGGYASGWTIVGEQGPELVNFTNPGRVYTAQQTANALKSSGNGNGNINIKFDIKNETGTQIEAQQTGSSFDGESYVIGVVLKAMANNTNGMRTIVKGLANA